MDTVLKYVRVSCGLVIAAIVISFSIYVFRTGDTTLKSFSSRLLSIFSSESEPEFTKYVGRTIDGKTVRSALEKYGGQYLFKIKTKRNAASFCVVTRPIKCKFISNFEEAGEYSDYSSASSIYYISTSGLFNTQVMRDEFGEILGVKFTEKGVRGLTAGVRKVYAPSLTNPTLDLVKKEYVKKLQKSEQELNATALTEKLTALKNKLITAETQREELRERAANVSDSSLDSDTTAYENAKSEQKDAQVRASEAWNSLSKALKAKLGVTASGHYEISKFNPDLQGTDDTTDLQYWITKFNQRGDSDEGDN